MGVGRHGRVGFCRSWIMFSHEMVDNEVIGTGLMKVGTAWSASGGPR